MNKWERLQAAHDLNNALWDLDFHNGWASILAGNSLAEFDIAYHRNLADAARQKVEAARAKLAPEVDRLPAREEQKDAA